MLKLDHVHIFVHCRVFDRLSLCLYKFLPRHRPKNRENVSIWCLQPIILDFLKALGHDSDELDNADSMQMVWFPSGGTPYRHITAQCPRLQKNSPPPKSGGGHGLPGPCGYNTVESYHDGNLRTKCL